MVTLGLTAVGTKRSCPSLIWALRHHYALVRTDAAVALGRVGDQDAVGPLCDVLASDPDRNVRANAAAALGKIGDDTCLPYLKVATEDDNESVKRIAQEALESLRNKTANVGARGRSD